MQESDLKRKALELSHGIFRIAERIHEAHLKNELHMLAVALLREGSLGAYGEAVKTLEHIQTFITFAEVVGTVAYADSQIIYREIQILTSVLESVLEQKSGKFDLESIFSQLPNEPGSTISGNEFVEPLDMQLPTSQKEDVKKHFPNSDRLQSVARKVAELGHAAIRDIIAAFPEVSERTLRYDLQKLCDQGVLERMGNGGPASYYKAKQVVEV